MIEVVIRAYDEVQILLELVIDSTLELTMKYEKRKLELMMKVILELTTSTRSKSGLTSFGSLCISEKMEQLFLLSFFFFRLSNMIHKKGSAAIYGLNFLTLIDFFLPFCDKS